MIYRETGQFKANYQDDQALFPIAQDRYVILAVLFVTFVALLIRAGLYFAGFAGELGRLQVLLALAPLEFAFVMGFLLIVLFTMLYLTYGFIVNLIYKGMVNRGEV